jgi:hypothetical protein
MRKREWDRCSDLKRMLFEVWGLATKHPANDRRLRLFTLLAGRRLWEQLGDEACRSAVALAWRQADDGLPADEVARQVDPILGPVYDEACATDSWELAKSVNVLAVLFRDPGAAAMQLITPHSLVGGEEPVSLLNPTEISACCGLLREIFGDRGLLKPIEPALLAWNDGAIPRLARAIYDERAFDRLPILADALEEAGCTDADILSHCRGPGPHVRGCWVVDLILGK